MGGHRLEDNFYIRENEESAVSGFWLSLQCQIWKPTKEYQSLSYKDRKHNTLYWESAHLSGDQNTSVDIVQPVSTAKEMLFVSFWRALSWHPPPCFVFPGFSDFIPSLCLYFFLCHTLCVRICLCVPLSSLSLWRYDGVVGKNIPTCWKSLWKNSNLITLPGNPEGLA